MRTLTEKAQIVALLAHEGQRYGDKPYSYHLRGVVELIDGYYKDDADYNELIQIAWLHDSIEDTRVSEDDLRKLGFSEAVILAVVAMTRRSDETYSRYIERLMGNSLAIKVKRADSLFNYLESRSQNKTGLMERYSKVLKTLDIHQSPLAGCLTE